MKTLLSTAFTLILLTACSTDSGEQSQYVSVDGERYEPTDEEVFYNEHLLSFGEVRLSQKDNQLLVYGTGRVLSLKPKSNRVVWVYFLNEREHNADVSVRGTVDLYDDGTIEFDVTTESGKEIHGRWKFTK